ncbi:MAG TPA: radical SAM family heme chaperone HemW [Casimicrobiaceae bacterium]|nr:radical SAM family heme chaperone HemW [Casimicrobiaceae bacterium]
MRPALEPPLRPTFEALPPLSVYVHIPWCVRKCPYCDFNSHEARGDVPQDAYVDAVLADLEQALPSVWGRRVHTVFIGGGTPSLFAPEAIDRLLAGLRARLPFVPGAEVTMEANPGTFERGRFAGFFAAGVNRLSIGVQSFDPAKLAALGRIHDADEARRATEAAMMIFGNVNLDLMFALPGQTLDGCEADVAEALAFGTPHLSFYQLTLEPNTLFHKVPPEGLPDDDLAADMQDLVAARLAAAGCERYEVSAYARPGARCAHNLNYWRFGDYLGLGAGAHGKVSLPGSIVREVRWKHPRQYMEKVAEGEPAMERREVARDEVGFEFALNALRLVDGVPASSFAERTGFPLATIARPLAEGARRGLIVEDPSRIAATERGRHFLNATLELFLPQRASPARTVPVTFDTASR